MFKNSTISKYVYEIISISFIKISSKIKNNFNLNLIKVFKSIIMNYNLDYVVLLI